jgi:hypothetical protein
MAALVLAQIPDPHVAASIAADKLALIRMDDNVVDRYTVRVIPLYIPGSCVPDLDCAIFRGGNEPLALAMERNASDVTSVTVEGEDGIGVRGLDVVELDRVMTGSGQITLVWRDTQPVDLRIWMRDGPGAYAGQRFPEPLGPVSVRIEVKVALGSFIPDSVIVPRCRLLAVRFVNTMRGRQASRTCAKDDRHIERCPFVCLISMGERNCVAGKHFCTNNAIAIRRTTGNFEAWHARVRQQRQRRVLWELKLFGGAWTIFSPMAVSP